MKHFYSPVTALTTACFWRLACSKLPQNRKNITAETPPLFALAEIYLGEKDGYYCRILGVWDH
ncbi:MAG: hypothetical protein ACLRXQ_01785 [Phascolarctobacterium faecium]